VVVFTLYITYTQCKYELYKEWTMRSTVCEDGNRRLLAKVVVPMGVREIAMFALANPQFHKPAPRSLADFKNLNKRQLFNVAKDTVAMQGNMLPENIVNEYWTPKQIANAFEHVTMLFPEVDS